MQNQIKIVGARENNLRNISLMIPKRKITVFTGVSGSGKSSLVFDTVAAEAQRQLNETFSNFVQGFLPDYGQPDVERIENLNAPIVIDQKRVGGSSRSTVGTYTDIAALLRLLFSRVGYPHVDSTNAFSFNSTQGMCLECEGIGRTVQLDITKFFDDKRSLNSGAMRHPDFRVGKWMWEMYTLSGLFDNDKAIADYNVEERNALLYGAELDKTYGKHNSKYEGIVERFTRMYLKKDVAAMSERNRKIFREFTVSNICPLCRGARLNQVALECTVKGRNIAELSQIEITELLPYLQSISDPVAQKITVKLCERIQHLIDIGLGYLSLDRSTTTLSGGESQRVKMIRHLGNSLTEMLYILDEPSIGLHARDVERLNQLLKKLRDKGNTVLVVEHDPDVIAVGDHIVDIGPQAGIHGGRIVFEGSYEALQNADTITGRFLSRQLSIQSTPRQPTGYMTITNAKKYNLKNITVQIPIGILTVVTGVAGSGKSTLIRDVFLKEYPNAVVIDQSAVTTNKRSTPATYTGIMDDIRKAFAQVNQVSPSLFSFNSKGSCQNCNGLGIVYTDMAFMDPIVSVCEICHGKRFRAEVLLYRLRNRTISDVLNMTVGEALTFFTENHIQAMLQSMSNVGLSYLKLGQPLSTVSGGEAQRLKLAIELHKPGRVYVMDEPTTGLHMADLSQLLKIFHKLVDEGSTVILIEHNLDIIKNADWIIDMGPEGGTAGGQIIFEGTPTQLRQAEHSYTAHYLQTHMKTLSAVT